MTLSLRAWALTLLVALLPAGTWASELKLFVAEKAITAPNFFAQIGWVKRHTMVRLAPDAATYLTADSAKPVTVRMQLFDDTTLVLQEQSRQTTAQGVTSIRYALQNDPQGSVLLSASQGNVVVSITTGDHRVYRVMPMADGVHRAEELDHSKFPECAAHSADNLALAQSITSAAAATPPASTGQPDSGAQINVLVAYTPAVQSAMGSTSAVQTLIANAIADANTGFSTSGVNTALNLVHSVQVNYNESGGFNAALNDITGTSDGKMDEVHTLRNTYAADLVVLLIDNPDYCGLAWLPSTVSTSNAGLGFSVTGYGCAVGNHSFAHEIGHNMGVHHDRYVASGGSPYPHGYGYVNKTARVRSIMAYNNDCAASGFNCTRVNHWSASDRTYSGPSGATVIGDTNNRNNDALNASANAIANYRVSAVTYTLSVTKAGTGSGTVTSAPAGINCGGDCSEAYDSGASVTLSAAPSAGHHFAGWSGGCASSGMAMSCSMTVTANSSVTATFGQGTVAPQPPVGLGAVAGSGSATLVFTPSSNNGGSAITSYTATCTAAGQASRTATGTSSPLVVTGLAGGVTYSCTVTATNASGTSQASSPVTVSPPAAAVFDLSPILMMLLD